MSWFKCKHKTTRGDYRGSPVLVQKFYPGIYRRHCDDYCLSVDAVCIKCDCIFVHNEDVPPLVHQYIKQEQFKLEMEVRNLQSKLQKEISDLRVSLSTEKYKHKYLCPKSKK